MSCWLSMPPTSPSIVPQRRHAVDGVELERGDGTVRVLLDGDQVEDPDLGRLDELHQRRHQARQGVQVRHLDDEVLDQVGRHDVRSHGNHPIVPRR